MTVYRSQVAVLISPLVPDRDTVVLEIFNVRISCYEPEKFIYDRLEMNLLGDCFVLFSAIAYGFSSSLMKIFSKDEDPVIISGYQFIMGGIFMIIIGLAFGGTIKISSLQSAGVMAYLALLSAVAYALWGILLKHNPVSRVSIFSFMTPVMGVILSEIMLTESSNVTPLNLILTILLVSGGIILLNYNKQK